MLHRLESTVALGLLAIVAAAFVSGCTPSDQGTKTDAPRAETAWQAPPGFDAMPIPADNPMTPEKVALGHQLFFDKRLSGDGALSCYACHVCEAGLTDGRPVAIGAFEKKLTRSSPTLWNIGYHSEFYWDGRAGSLEDQAFAAWKGGNMGADPDAVVAALNGVEGYRSQFQEVFGTDVTVDGVKKALGAYMRTILCGDTAFDRWREGDAAAISESARRGHALFSGKARCTECHSGVLMTDLLYHNVGIGMDKDDPDVGRFKVTGDEKDRGAFKTPTLRDITRTAPYFHDGSVESLAEVVQIMTGGGVPNPHLDEKLEKVELTAEEFGDLLAFLGTLECECTLEEPELP